MRNVLFLCCVFVLCCLAIKAPTKDFDNIPEATIAESKKMPDNKMVYLQGHLNNHTFSDATGVIKANNTFLVDPKQKIEILARIHNSFFNHEIDIITISPI